MKYLSIFLLVLALPSLACAQNLVANGSFEVNTGGFPEGWKAVTNEDAFTFEKGNAAVGETSLRVHLNGNETQLSQPGYLTLEPGKVYTLSAYVKSENLVSKGEQGPADGVRIQLINLGWSWGTQSLLKVEENTGWERYERTFTVPSAVRFPYKGKPNTQYKVILYFKDLEGDVWIDGVQLEEGSKATPFSETQASVDPVNAADVAASEKKAVRYPEVPDPLFAELQGGDKMDQPIFYYGWGDTIADQVMRPFAKKFAHRYVEAEEKAELADTKAGYVVYTSGQGRGGTDSYPTMRQIFRPDAPGIAPAVMKNGWAWTMDPRFLASERNAAKTLATQSLDYSPGNVWGNTYGLMMGDERFESRAIKAPAKDKWYPELQIADAEVREKFGFGKFGIPESDADKDPFKRIAHRRWANAKLAENLKLISAEARAINPKLVMMAPIIAGGVPTLDIEEVSKDFDLFCNQSWNTPGTYVQMFVTGADTKALVDLSHCPVVAFPQHASTRDPEAVREQFSQAMRNGAAGVSILATEWYDRELEEVKYINTSKWRALKESAKAISKMNKLNFPKADTAILFASNTYLTFDTPKMANREYPQVYSNYVALGPEARSWFKFVSDRQIERGEVNLADYKLIYIPLATYQTPAVVGALKQYAMSGGVIVAADPGAFTWNINGESLSKQWSEVTGVAFGPPRSVTEGAVVTGGLAGVDDLPLTLPKPGLEMKFTDPSVKPLAMFPDGSPAAAIRALGKGHVITFGANPYDSSDKNPSAYQLTAALQKTFGAKTGQDIWRFKLPPLQNQPEPLTAQGQCLTGNFVALSTEGPKPAKNVNTGGRYRYDQSPDGNPDIRKEGWISFGEGKLTNRVKAYQTRVKGNKRGPSNVDSWIVTFQKSDPAGITFDLKKAYDLRELKLFYSGALPAVQVLGSDDETNWKHLADVPSQLETADVLDAAVKLSGEFRFLRLEFAKRESPCPLELAEVEIWGPDV